VSMSLLGRHFALRHNRIYHGSPKDSGIFCRNA
jgi:hypothetical protein